MKTFNLKKHATKSKVIKPYDKMLSDQNNKNGIEETKNVITDKQLKDHKKNLPGDKIYEKQLEDVRVGAANVITEKQIDGKTDGYQKMREVTDNLVTEMAKETETKRAEDYNKANFADKRDTSFWDDYVNTQIPADDVTKISDNHQPSQLVENYDSREDFNKQNNDIKKSAQVKVQTLSDADAMIFHIYRKAAQLKRELTSQEREQIQSINSGKIRLLRQ